MENRDNRFKPYLERLRRSPPPLAISDVYVQRLMCWFRIGLGRFESDIERDITQIRKTRLERKTGELF